MGSHGHTGLGVRLHSTATDLNAAIDEDVHQGDREAISIILDK